MHSCFYQISPGVTNHGIVVPKQYNVEYRRRGILVYTAVHVVESDTCHASTITYKYFKKDEGRWGYCMSYINQGFS